jgi:DNA-directed RNA polymerase specialized sigma24 family protein
VERDLVEAARRGDRASYEALVRLKVDAVHRTAQAILGNAHEADDVVQDAFVAAWRQLPRLRRRPSGRVEDLDRPLKAPPGLSGVLAGLVP